MLNIIIILLSLHRKTRKNNNKHITNNKNPIIMTIVATNNTMVTVSNNTTRRANVIARRTQSDAMGVIKAQLIDLLKSKLQSGVAHFTFLKKDGTIREAWGTTSHNLMKASINGNGISRDAVNCVCYWDVQKGGFRSLRFENLIQVF